MSLLATIPLFRPRSKTPRQVMSYFWEDRTAVLERDVNLFCWNRAIDPRIATYLERLLEKELPAIRFHATIEELEERLNKAKSTWDHEDDRVSHLFWNDVHRLTSDFLSLNRKKSGTVHLKVIKDDACSKFHMDGYSLRLFTTYIGKGTEWLPENATNRKGLGQSNELIVKDPLQIQRMESFEVGILKGGIPGAISSVGGIVHRSPEISQTGGKRIILRVDI